MHLLPISISNIAESNVWEIYPDVVENGCGQCDVLLDCYLCCLFPPFSQIQVEMLGCFSALFLDGQSVCIVWSLKALELNTWGTPSPFLQVSVLRGCSQESAQDAGLVG